MAVSATTISLDLDSVVHQTLLTLVAEEHTTSLQIVSNAIRQYAERRIDLADAKSSYEQYMRDGLHVTGEEMDEWFTAVERGEDPPVPECHV